MHWKWKHKGQNSEIQGKWRPEERLIWDTISSSPSVPESTPSTKGIYQYFMNMVQGKYVLYFEGGNVSLRKYLSTFLVEKQTIIFKFCLLEMQKEKIGKYITFI